MEIIFYIINSMRVFKGLFALVYNFMNYNLRVTLRRKGLPSRISLISNELMNPLFYYVGKRILISKTFPSYSSFIDFPPFD